MTDQRPEDSDHTMMPPDLLPIHQRLLADGERWRRRVPDGKGLARDVEKALTTQAATGADSRAPAMSEDQAGTVWQPPRWSPDLASHTNTPPQIPPMRRNPTLKGSERIPVIMTRVRTGAAAAAAVVIVGLFALLLAHVTANRGTGGSSSVPATPSAQGTATPEPQPPQVVQPGQLPVVAASDPHTLYKVVNGALKRSTDGGATYTTTGWPKSDITSVDDASVAVSPLDASHVFVTVYGTKNGQGCSPSDAPYPAMVSRDSILASGYVPCVEQYISADGGATWHAVKLPIKGVLGATTMMRLTQGTYEATSVVFQAQGQRLYAAEAFASQSGALLDSPGVRLLASDDGGATWNFADKGVPQSNRYLCDFAAAPASSTVYATTSPSSCANESAPTVSLWRSDNGGTSWTSMGSLGTAAEGGLVVNQQGALYTFLPSVTTASHSMSVTNTPRDAVVSQDGGASFSHAPSAGLPSGAILVGPLATLSNGSVVYEVSGALGATGGLYTWSNGQSAWQPISGSKGISIASVTVTPAGGQDTLTIVDQQGKITTLSAA